MKIIVKEGEMQETTELIGLRPHIIGSDIIASFAAPLLLTTLIKGESINA